MHNYGNYGLYKPYTRTGMLTLKDDKSWSELDFSVVSVRWQCQSRIAYMRKKMQFIWIFFCLLDTFSLSSTANDSHFELAKELMQVRAYLRDSRLQIAFYKYIDRQWDATDLSVGIAILPLWLHWWQLPDAPPSRFAESLGNCVPTSCRLIEGGMSLSRL